MSVSDADRVRFRRWTTLLYVVGISFLFWSMIRGYVVALIMAAVLAALMRPVQEHLSRWLGGRRTLAAALTVLATILLVVLPVGLVLSMIVAQGIQVMEQVSPWVQRAFSDPVGLEEELIRRFGIPAGWFGQLQPALERLSEAAGAIGQFVFQKLSAAAAGTAGFLLQIFVALYAQFFFLLGGRDLVARLVHYLPVTPAAKDQLISRFGLAARAVIRGTFLIGLIQGALGALALWAVGIPGSIFWGAVMTFLSVLPGVGTSLVWIPAAIYLFATGSTFPGLLFVAWNAGVVGSVDNVLRPRLVGKDIQLPDLMILLGTLGGLQIFGAAGLVVGPIVAALFVTIWQLYGEVFSDYLVDPAPAAEEPGNAAKAGREA